MAFYRTITKRGALPFTVDLVVDSSDLGERTCHFVPGSVKLSRQEGLAHVVVGTLEVDPIVNPDEEDDDNAIVDAYNTSQGYEP
jgi:hypothetical protein